MEKEDAFFVDNVKGGLCVDYIDAGIVGRCYNGSNKDKGKDSLESKYMAEDSLSKKFPESDKGKGKEAGGPSVNMTEEGKNKHNKQNKGKNGPMRTTVYLVLTRNQSWNVKSVARLVTSKDIVVVVKRTTQMLVVQERGIRTNPKTKVDAIAWWIDFGATTHVYKDHGGDNPTVKQVRKRAKWDNDDYVCRCLILNGISDPLLDIYQKWTLKSACSFYVIEPNESVSINSIIESREEIFDENRFSLIPRPKDVIPNFVESQMDDHSDDVPSEIPELCKGKRVRKAKSYGFDF
nr:zinc finger, CCHC-type [Tanacetum cinerariifolium]